MRVLTSPSVSSSVGGAAPKRTGRGSAAVTARLDRLRRFLGAYWLRPENAFWMTLRSLVLDRCVPRAPMLDLACGDGVFSFLHAGGVFADEFDVFQAVGRLDEVATRNADMFDAASERYQPAILHPPGRRIEVGADHKPALLAKAAALGLYRRRVELDANRPLPFTDGAFAVVYCNSAYWIREIDTLLGELRRIVRPGGQIILHIKLADMRRYTLEPFRKQLGARFLAIIDRGRRDCWPTVASRGEWERRFRAAGLAVRDATPFVTRTHAQIWDVGLRPLAPLLVRMANGLTARTRAAIKREWVALFMELLDPICRPDFDLFATPDEPAEIQYVLTGD